MAWYGTTIKQLFRYSSSMAYVLEKPSKDKGMERVCFQVVCNASWHFVVYGLVHDAKVYVFDNRCVCVCVPQPQIRKSFDSATCQVLCRKVFVGDMRSGEGVSLMEDNICS